MTSPATLHLEAGERTDVVAQRLGHASVRTSLDVHAAVHPASHRDAAARLGEVFDGWGWQEVATGAG